MKTQGAPATSFSGRVVPILNTPVDIDVRLMITPQDYDILQDIQDHGLKVKDVTNCNNDILTIYKFTRTNPLLPYIYEYDKQLFKIDELWQFPFETRCTKLGDCEDWALSLASYLIASGVPYWRVRCVAGETWKGFGHATVYVLADDLKTWVHINSTTPISMINANNLTDLPKSNDSSDDIGIRDVWFSFNKQSYSIMGLEL